MKNAAAVVGQHQEHVKNLETDGRDGEKINGDQLLGMILKEGTPSLRRWFAATRHVFADAALSDLDAQFEQFAMDAGCTPTGILLAHSADKISDLVGDDWSSGLAASHHPGPESAEPSTMPRYNGFWLDDGQCGSPVSPELGQNDPEKAISRG